MKKKYMAVLRACVVIAAGSVQAQTTLSGDHIVTGNLDVGTSSAKGDLTVTGQTGSSALPGIKVTGDGGVLFQGTFGTGQIPEPGTSLGTRFMWYPKKAALRAGLASGYIWNDANIGNYSVAFSQSAAPGEYSTAMSASFAAGFMSTSLSNGYAAGECATAMGVAIAEGDYSTAMIFGEADGFFSLAIGGIAVGDYSVAIGGNGVGWASAEGDKSTAIGAGATAIAYSSTVIGSGTAAGNATTWVDADPVLVIGYGTGSLVDPVAVRNRNALTVYKNGKITIAKRQGDIVMGEFGSGGGD